jgi:hypothetical protein
MVRTVGYEAMDGRCCTDQVSKVRCSLQFFSSEIVGFMDWFQFLPKDILLFIGYTFLDERSLLRMACVNKRFSEVFSSPMAWKNRLCSRNGFVVMQRRQKFGRTLQHVSIATNSVVLVGDSRRKRQKLFDALKETCPQGYIPILGDDVHSPLSIFFFADVVLFVMRNRTLDNLYEFGIYGKAIEKRPFKARALIVTMKKQAKNSESPAVLHTLMTGLSVVPEGIFELSAYDWKANSKLIWEVICDSKKAEKSEVYLPLGTNFKSLVRNEESARPSGCLTM